MGEEREKGRERDRGVRERGRVRGFESGLQQRVKQVTNDLLDSTPASVPSIPGGNHKRMRESVDSMRVASG